MPNNQTKALVHGSAMLVIFTMMMMLSRYIPLAFLLVVLFTPLPFAWYSAKYKSSFSIVIALLGCMLTMLTCGFIMLPFAMIFAVVGVVMGYTIRTGKSKLHIFMSTGLAVLLSTAVIFLLYVRIADINMIELGLDEAKKNYEQTIAQNEELFGQAQVSQEKMDATIQMMELSVPSTVTISSFFIAFLIVSLNLPILRRLRLEVPTFPPFQDMRLPRAILWYYMIILCINLFIRPEAGSTLDMVILNISVILWMLLILQGVSFIHYVFAKRGIPNALKWLTTLLVLPLSSFMILLGIVDLGFDVRSLVKGKHKK
ncbi:YybS family protein [Lysinibacillus piscis]|uniref:Membrane protein n=1 Tax=Lysinibacillus piscis TaxID=2518931 RepID=A0ABQ5NNY0_9BACI|nr:YybS family protein [Lysinibacillus sp. KH24]GLC90091.1 membrane protein [Lysinibacillus sp. KH24]